MNSGRYWQRPWSLVDSCTRCSPGCMNCWALAMDNRFHREGPVTPRWDRLEIPLKVKKPTVWAVWNDLGHEEIPYAFFESAMVRMRQAEHHVFLILTKRPERIQDHAEFYCKVFGIYPLPGNVWLGTTCENQAHANKRIPILLQTPAAHYFVSIEPMLGPVDIELYLNWGRLGEKWNSLDWVILGGETGPKARPCQPDWVRSVRDQCTAAGVPFWFKAWGKYLPELEDRIGPNAERYPIDVLMDVFTRSINGREWNQRPF